MLRPHNPSASSRRRAVILMVVLVLLTLFAIVGLAFVLYANAEGEASRVYRETTNGVNRIDISTSSLGNWAMGQFLFDTGDPIVASGFPAPGGSSALRGQSLGRDLYGYNADNASSNIYPFNGVGHLHNLLTLPPPYSGPPIDEHQMMNYAPFLGPGGVLIDNFLHDPERLGPAGPPAQQFRTALSQNPGPYTGGWNSSYTFPDGNHVFLGAIDSSGNLLMPSFHRPWMFGSLANSGTVPDTVNPNWTNTQGKYMTLRMRPIDHLLPGETGLAVVGGQTVALPGNRPIFPYPADANGDVKNLQGYPWAGNDSIWVDLDYPVQTAADGTKFKPLFAFFITDLDGRINLNTHGNIRGAGNTHASNQGWGKWEVNLAQVLNQPASGGGAEWPQLFVGGGGVTGRYGTDMPTPQPGVGGTQAPFGKTPRVYMPMDYDGANESGGFALTGPIMLPTATGAPALASFPVFPPGYGNSSATERTNHPLNYDSQYPKYNTSNDNRFGAGNLTNLLNGGTNSTTVSSAQLGQLLPNNLAANATGFRIRNLITTDSAAFDRPGLTPWIFDRSGVVSPNAYGYAAGTNPHMPPTGAPVNFPALSLRTSGAVPASSEFRIPSAGPAAPADWRAVDVTAQTTILSSALAKVDLNRFLPPYPHQGQGTTLGTFNPTPMTAANDRFDDAGAIQNQAAAAVQARQQLANDIYRRFLAVTGVPPVATPASPTAAELAPRRWLAQLAVNIVDFIDEDEISTPFNFYTAQDAQAATFNIAALGTVTTTNPSTTQTNSPELPLYWVFGTELPKVVVNEVLAEYNTSTTPFDVKVWVELFSPLPSPAQANPSNPTTYPSGVDQQDTAALPLWIPAGALPSQTTAYSPYVVAIADTNQPAGGGGGGGGGTGGLLTPPSTVAGTPQYGNDVPLGTPNWFRNVPTDFNPSSTSNTLQTIDGKPATPVIAPQTFFLVGPGADAHGTIATNTAKPGVVPPGTPMLTSTTMKYSAQLNGAGTQFQYVGPLTTAGTPYAGSTYFGPSTAAAPVNITDGPITATATTTTGISVLLRRLANPHLPPNINPVYTAGPLMGQPDPTYNPYVTVDYMKSDSKKATVPNFVMPQDATDTTKGWASLSKPEPYASNTNLYVAPTIVAGGTADSFGIPNTNGTPQVPYNWLVHLDRQLISAMELLHVSGFQPHELTQRFLQPAPTGSPTPGPFKQNLGHRVNWFDETNRLYRAFEFLGTHDRASGVSAGGRQPGMININTVYDQAVFNALCDANGTSNGFNQPQIDAIWSKLASLRTPNGFNGTERPFLGMGIGNTLPTDPTLGVLGNNTVKPSNTGIEDTFLRSIATPAVSTAIDQRLFEVPWPATGSLHPYQSTELMTKIYGNLTNRSNVFAVWITVGFFEVAKDPTSGAYAGDNYRPVKLGPEIGLSTGTNIRHRMFAVVDRTKMNISAQPVTTMGAVGAALLNSPNLVGVAATASLPTATGVPWTIVPGSVLNIDQGTPSEETVVVQAVTAGSPGNITATFTKQHANGASVNIPGNPGPQPSFTTTTPGFSGIVLTYQPLE
jgi:hypothetical protein